VPKVSGTGKKALKTVLLGNATVLAKRAGKVKVVIHARKPALKLYRTHASKYRISVTLTSLSKGHRAYTKKFLVGRRSLAVLARLP